jgi:hypothetical protein
MPHKLQTLSSLSCILAPGFFLVIPSPAAFCLSAVSVFYTGLSHRWILTSLAGKSTFTGLQSSSNPLKVVLHVPNSWFSSLSRKRFLLLW